MWSPTYIDSTRLYFSIFQCAEYIYLSKGPYLQHTILYCCVSHFHSHVLLRFAQVTHSQTRSPYDYMPHTIQSVARSVRFLMFTIKQRRWSRQVVVWPSTWADRVFSAISFAALSDYYCCLRFLPNWHCLNPIYTDFCAFMLCRCMHFDHLLLRRGLVNYA